ncbi:hypothetical protein AB1Y20_023384 [Prymnesium parvum]|uniref:Uncharacterized protein n=1 Tax=Prymnesium parvum TaxID=97485 RepID=A0AB34JG88_PRYPA
MLLLCAAAAALRLAPGTGSPLAARPRARPVVAAAFRSVDEFEAAASAYLSSLNETARSDPSFPSPLSYKALQSHGRVDLVEGCMEYGGYVSVSRRLGARVTFENSIDAPAAPVLGGGGAEPQVNLVLSAAAKEERLAQQLQRVQQAADDATDGDARAGAPARAWQSSELPPLPLGGGGAASPSPKPEDQGFPFLRLDEAQRGGLLGVVLLLSAGFGRSSEQALPAEVVGSFKLAAVALSVAHLAMAGYGAFLATQSGEAAAAWFVKILLTGFGGLSELTRSTDDKPNEA